MNIAQQVSDLSWKLEFDSFSKLLEASESERDPKCENLEQSSLTDSEMFTGTKTYSEAMEIARLGWKDGLEKMQAMTLSLAQVSSNIIKDYYRNEIVGSWVDIGAFVNGQPDCMVSMHHEESIIGGGTKRIVKIVVNCSVTNGITSEQILIRGSSVCALVQCLECAGYSVEIIGVNCARSLVAGKHENKTFTISFPIKKAGDSIELDRLAFLMGHPSMPRRICFSIKERLEYSIVKSMGFHADEGYGTSENVSMEERGDIYIPCAKGHHPEWQNIETAKLWVIEKLKEQGIEFEN